MTEPEPLTTDEIAVSDDPVAGDELLLSGEPAAPGELPIEADPADVVEQHQQLPSGLDLDYEEYPDDPAAGNAGTR